MPPAGSAKSSPISTPMGAAVYGGLTPALIHRHNRRGPRYTSYPTVPNWQTGQFAAEYGQWLAREGTPDRASAPLSLYLHLPFCRRLCTFCGCNQKITHDRALMARYRAVLAREMATVTALTGRRRVAQLHLGGGTPTWYRPEDLNGILSEVATHFDLDRTGELAVEVHPKVTTHEHLAVLAQWGFRRLSLGVQDLDPVVQAAINREQTLEETTATVTSARALGYTSINFDLVYGLPRQTREGWAKTLQSVSELGPDRLAVYSFAYIPGMFKTHARAIHAEDLPAPELKAALYIDVIQHFTGGGYEMIGMDHYARPSDELAVAARERTLHRNFMGYTTLKGLVQLGLGVSAISDLGDAYFQNEKELDRYLQLAEAGQLASIRHCALTADDRLRRDAIESILCHGEVEGATLAKAHGDEVVAQLRPAFAALGELAAEGLTEGAGEHWRLTPLGRLFSRNAAMPFDAYLGASETAPGAGPPRPLFSATV